MDDDTWDCPAVPLNAAAPPVSSAPAPAGIAAGHNAARNALDTHRQQRWPWLQARWVPERSACAYGCKLCKLALTLPQVADLKLAGGKFAHFGMQDLRKDSKLQRHADSPLHQAAESVLQGTELQVDKSTPTIDQ